MAWALSESIFCWPRTRADFFRERLPVERVLLALAEAVAAWCLVVGGFLTLASGVESAAEGRQSHTVNSAHAPMKTALRISAQTRTTELLKQTFSRKTPAK